VAGIATRLRAGRSEVQFSARIKDLVFKCPDRLCRPPPPSQPPIQWVRWFFPLPGRGVDSSPLHRVEVKNEWSYNSTPAICFLGVDRDNFTFLPCTSSPKHPDRLWGPHSLLLGGYRGIFSPTIKWPGSYMSTLPYAFMTCTGTTQL
jgi:hypothetical protein